MNLGLIPRIVLMALGTASVAATAVLVYDNKSGNGVLALLILGGLLILSGAGGGIPQEIRIEKNQFAVLFGEQLGWAAAGASDRTRDQLTRTLAYLDQISPTAATHAREALDRERRLDSDFAPAIRELKLQSLQVKDIAGHRPDKILVAPGGGKLLVDEWTSPRRNHAATYERCLEVVKRSKQVDPTIAGLLVVSERKRAASFRDDAAVGFWYVQIPAGNDAGRVLAEAVRDVLGSV